MDERTAQASGLMKAWQPLTRGGYEYQIYAIYEGQEYPIHGAVLQDGKWRINSWKSNGKALSDILSDRDLLPALPEKRTLKGWVNVYPCDGASHIWHTERKVADESAMSNRIACVQIEREYTLGEGL